MRLSLAGSVRRIAALALFLAWLAPAAEPSSEPSPDKTPSNRNLTQIRTTVETLRGKKVLREVPVFNISEKQLRTISDRELDKAYPGASLTDYRDLLSWLDVVPPQTDLKDAFANLLVDQVAGLYDSETKEMCIPVFQSPSTNAAKVAAMKKLDRFSGLFDDMVLVHEYTHALEDQYWAMDDPKDDDSKASTDRATAHHFLLEGSATRLMIEALPAQSERSSPGSYFPSWNLIHSALGEAILDSTLGQAWKGGDAVVPGVPEMLSRSQAMPYSFGYSFCTRILREWGLDGLDYIYDHRPVSSEQVMHPEKSWEWRDLPVQINLPETLPGGWKQLATECLGESDMAVFFGCGLKNLNRGLQVARGWDGDQAGLYSGPGGRRLLLWASSWDSTTAAAQYADACVREREIGHQAVLTEKGKGFVAWKRPDGQVGSVRREGHRVILFETDNAETLAEAATLGRAITFTEPPEDAERDAANSALRRFNPFLSWQRDADYSISRTLYGLLSRHDRNSVGSADSVLGGLLGESRRTASFSKWELGLGLVVRHESEARRGMTKTTLLPWGILASHFSTPLPHAPTNTLARTSVLWGLLASSTSNGSERSAVRVLPWGLLYRGTTVPGRSSIHVLATGVSRSEGPNHSGGTTRFRFLGVPIWTRHSREVVK